MREPWGNSADPSLREAELGRAKGKKWLQIAPARVAFFVSGPGLFGLPQDSRAHRVHTSGNDEFTLTVSEKEKCPSILSTFPAFTKLTKRPDEPGLKPGAPEVPEEGFPAAHRSSPAAGSRSRPRVCGVWALSTILGSTGLILNPAIRNTHG